MSAMFAGWGRKLLWVLAACTLVAAVVGYVPAAPWSRRAPSARETTLYFFAQELGEPALCRRISWDAYRSYGSLFGGGGASRWRSDCYERVAEARHDDEFCWEARPFVDLNPVSPGYSALACSRRTQGGYRSGITLPDPALVQAFKELGYELDDMHLEGVMQPPARPSDTYLSLVKDAAVMTRVPALLEHGDPALQGNDRSYLADLAALAGGDAKWCAAIPLAEISVHQQATFRDWCYFTVAYNNGNTRICAAMTPANKEPKVIAAEAAGVQPGIAEQMSLHTQCQAVGAYGAKRTYLFGPELPTASGQLERLLAVLGAAPQRAGDWPVHKQAAYLREVVTVLAARTPPDSARDTARAELVQKLLALPQ